MLNVCPGKSRSTLVLFTRQPVAQIGLYHTLNELYIYVSSEWAAYTLWQLCLGHEKYLAIYPLFAIYLTFRTTS